MWNFFEKNLSTRFFLVGFSTFLIDFSINNLIIALLNLEPTKESIIANLISVPIAFVYNFSFQRKWTFKRLDKTPKRFFRFLLIGVINFIMSTTLLGVSVEIITDLRIVPSDYLVQSLSKLIVQGAIMIWSYIIYKQWVFNEARK